MGDQVEYQVRVDDGRRWRFVVDVERGSAAPPGSGLPVWTELSNHPCPGCPLEATRHTHCPAAVDLAPLVEAFSGMASYERVDVRVVTEERMVQKSTDLQELLRSLVGLLMSTSGCPVLARFKPMGRTHLPFSTLQETLFRAVAVHLLRAHFAREDGAEPDLDLGALRAFYADLAVINRELAARLRAAGPGDAHMNAIVQLFTLGVLVSDELDCQVGALRELVR